MGALAWVAKKSTTNSFLEFEDRNGTWTFAVPDLTAMELRSGLEPIRRRFLSSAHAVADLPLDSLSAGTLAGSVEERLTRFERLRDEGTITQHEYDVQRSRVIAEL